VFITRDGPGGWFVILHEHGWLFGSFREAVAEARQLAWGFSLPVRVEGRP
jgi:hypothetical protein